MSQQTLAELQLKQPSSKENLKKTQPKPTDTNHARDSSEDTGDSESDDPGPEGKLLNKSTHLKSTNSGNTRQFTDDSGDCAPDKPDVRPKNTRYIPIPKWPNYHPWPTIGGIRHLVFFKDTNGFATAFKKVGRIILIDETEFFRCVERINKGG